MKKSIGTFIKSSFSALNLFLDRHPSHTVKGYELGHDLRALLPDPQPLCFDIGANRGQTIQFLTDCFPDPIIHAFEPASPAFSGLSGQSFGNRVRLHQLAVGQTVGEAEFRNYKRSELSSFLAMNPDGNENIFAQEELISTETVRVETLDNFCQSHAIERINLLKIDTQGFEMPVLQGGLLLFGAQAIDAVLLELNFAALYKGQSDPLEIIAFLRAHNMRLIDFYEKERADEKELSWTTALFVRHSA